MSILVRRRQQTSTVSKRLMPWPTTLHLPITGRLPIYEQPLAVFPAAKKGVEGHEETRNAFEFMLRYVGADIASGPVWMECITFLKVVDALEDSQRMTSMRKVYQKAIVTPNHHIEQLWRDYENSENSVSRQLAKGLVSEYQTKYNSARAVYRERKKYFDEIDWNMVAVPPKDSSKEETQWMAWKRFLAFEK